jgi:uncharacterized protein DUF6232
MSSLATAERIAGQAPPTKHEFGRGELKIRGNTLVIGNSIYSIDNISTITFSDLRRPVPTIVWIILGMGVICMLAGARGAFLGLLLVALAVYLLYLNWKSRAAANYSLAIQMNGGNTAVILGNNGDFLKAIALELYEVIETERPGHATFNIDRSIKIDNITGSVVPVGGGSGDIVNNVRGI